MDSKQRFVLVFAGLIMIPFVVLTFFNSNDLGLFVISYTIIYFALRLTMNPKMRLRVDVLGFILLALFILYVSQRVLSILSTGA